jgi:hypothetical protein
MSRTRADRLAHVEQVAAVLVDDPHATANAVLSPRRGRRRDVLRIVRAIRSAALSRVTLDGRETRFPNRAVSLWQSFAGPRVVPLSRG